MTRYKTTLCSYLYLALAAGASLQAQIAPTTQGNGPILLSPFNVNTDKDNGYIAADSILGGRLSTSLLTTPSDISVLTHDFLNDIGATDYIQATAYLTNTYATPLAGQDFGTQANFRGLGGGFPTRNYFKQNVALDYYNVDRIESARGPNALLFGDGIVGGIINTTTKQAKIGRTIHEASVRVDQYGSVRFTADINQTINQYAAVRLNLVDDHDRNWIDSYFKNRIGATLAATVRPFRSDEVRFEFEAGDTKTNWSPQNYTDGYSVWNGTPFVGPSTTNPNNAIGVNRYTTDKLIYINGVGVQNFLNYGQTQGSNFAQSVTSYALVPNQRYIGRDFTLEPTNAVGDIRPELFAMYWTHQWFPGLSTEFATQYAKQERATVTFQPNALQIDINTLLPGGTTNPHFGQLYAEAPDTHTDQTNRIYDYRLVNAYEIPFLPWKQTINTLISRRVEFFFANDFRWARNNNPTVTSLQNAQNYFYYRVYAGDRAASLIPERPTDQNGYTFVDSITRLRSQRQQLDTAEIATVASIWKDRITIIGGFRHDFYKSREYQIGSYDAVTGLPGVQATLIKELTANVSSAGATYFPIPQVGVYVNVSQTFNPIGAGDASLYQKQFGATHGTGDSGGLRFKLFDGRVVGSFGYYDVTEAGRVTGYGNTEINRIWTNINMSQKNLPTGYRDTSDINSRGYEFDAVANATRDLKLRFNYSVPKTKQSNALPDTISYFNANLPIWRAAESDPLTTNVPQIEADIATLQARIQSGNPGRALNLQPDFVSSGFGDYTVPSGFLRALRIGGGASFVGRRIIGNSVTNAYDYVKAPTYYTFTGTLGYSVKVASHNIKLQLNVNNLLNYTKPIYLNIRAYNGKNYKDTFYYIEPRKFLLTATTDF